jgi:hypothetical protein
MTIREIRDSGIINKFRVVLFPIDGGCGLQWGGTLGNPASVFGGKEWEIPDIILDSKIIELEIPEVYENTINIMIGNDEMRKIADEMHRINMEALHG